MGKNYKILINSLSDFYQESDNLSHEFLRPAWEKINNDDSPSFKGLSLEDIHKFKWNYIEGLNKLKEIEKDIQLGGRRHKYKYDDNDGDDMNFDRYLESLPCMYKRTNSYGKGSGKFVHLHISIAENAWCKSSNLLIRSYTVMRIIDLLESQGYRIQVTAYADNEYPGNIIINGNQEPINLLQVEVVVKKFEDPLIKGQILTAISPWFFRHWMFKFWLAKFKMTEGLGHSCRLKKEETISDIYIQTGEALTELDAEKTIDRILKLFDLQQ